MDKKFSDLTSGIFWEVVICVSGTVSPLLMFLLVIFTLYVNENKRMRKTAVTAVEIWLIFAAIKGIWNIIDNTAVIVTDNIISFNTVNSRILAIITIVETACFIIMGGKAVFENGIFHENGKEKRILPKYEEKQTTVNTDSKQVMTRESTNNSEETEKQDKAEIMFCRNCGNKMKVEDAFCMNCGTPK